MPTPKTDALEAARRRERVTQAAWRRRRAEVARLVAAGEEAAAQRLLAQAGVAEEPALVAVDARPLPEPVQEARQPRSKAHAAEPKAKPTPTRGKTKAPRTKTSPKPSRQASTRVARPAKPKRRRQRRTWTLWLRERPPWAVSLVAHGTFLTVLGLLTFATLGEPAFSLTASLGDDAWDDMPVEASLATLELDAELPDALEAEPIELASALDLESLIEPVAMEPLADLGALSGPSTESLSATVPAAGPSGDGDSNASAGGGSPRTPGGAGRVSFFGSESEAERVVFVVDNSGSMQRGRMETTLYELQSAVNRLSMSQEFYVVFFSDQAYPMFYPESAEGLAQATRANKRRLEKWLHTVEICLGGRLLDAMEIAAGLEPDVVYLITDGDIRSERVTTRMTTPGSWAFTIHTLGMGARTPQHAELLAAIAANTGGVYRPVAANPAAVARSRLRPIPYHRTPGEVWGSAIQAWD